MTEPEYSIASLERGFYLEDWFVAPHSNALSRKQKGSPDVNRHLESKAMQVLLHLASHAGQFIPREELLAAVWGTQFVTEDVLTGAVAGLRKAFHDNPKSPHFIETRRNVGYRLIVPVKPLVSDVETANKRRPGWQLMAVTLILAIGLFVLGRIAFMSSVQTTPTIAVLPFADFSPTSDSAYFADAVTEALIQQLAELQQFRVISRTSVMPYKATEKTAQQIAAELGVDLFIEGSVLQEQGQVRVTAQLIDAVADVHLWTDHFDRPMQDIFRLINDVAIAISMPIAELVGGDRAGSANEPPLHITSLPPDVLDDYLKARYLLAQGGVEFTQQALEIFDGLTIREAAFFGGHLGRAQALLALFKSYRRGPEILDDALRAVNVAVQLNPRIADVYRCRGQILFFRNFDIEAAESDYLHAIDLNASDHIAYRRYAWLLAAQQRFAAADLQLEEVKRLNPLYYADAANALLMLYMGRVDDAIHDLQNLDSIAPDSADIHSVLWRAYLAAGRDEEAARVMLNLLHLQGLDTDRLAGLHNSVENAEYTDFYTAVLQQPVFLSPLRKALLYLQIDQNDAALDMIEQAWLARDPNIAYVHVMPGFQALHRQPRFLVLLERLTNQKNPPDI